MFLKIKLAVIVRIHNGISITCLFCTQLHLSAFYSIIMIMLNAGKHFPEALFAVYYMFTLFSFLLEFQPQLAVTNYRLPLKEIGNFQLFLHLKSQKLPLPFS